MKNLKHLLAALVFVSLSIFISCGKDEGGGGTKTDPADDQAELLVDTWTLTSNGAQLESAAQADWNGLTLTYTGDGDGGSYTTSGSQSTEVWPNSGNWEFDGTDIGTIVRSDGVEMDISSVSSSGLTLSFTISSSSGTRTSGVEGNWTFTFTN